ncbi:putative ABC-transporter transmembrane protein [Flexivirga endophytica]|uniref:ABC-transporter transmembrane protein n=1 Tax=Flexivirga endophytica TaxID=1849103 RepID=A0A916WX14_9MICO|nr:metal ABC transporter permease [Flexivirga endophytica]GGB36426.1 putative ABC-transporter transmembrane protein [Flexivirga endophytica]GHB44117.1 putative ABC-transporter transmembrane protein [Flexivirga endophytica]
MTNIFDMLQYPFAQHALIAATLIALTCGLVAPFVVMRDMAFAVHGTAELSFPSAVAGLLIASDAVSGALLGSLVVATAFALLGRRRSESNTAIGVVLAFGLGLGVFLLSFYNGFSSAATNILFGSLVSASTRDVMILGVLAVLVVITMVIIFRPLLFASVDPAVAIARGVPVRRLGLIFLLLLALTVTEAAQVVGTLLVLSLAITPAAAARRWTANPIVFTGLSVLFALVAADGGFLLSLALSDTDIKASVLISFVSFAIYLLSFAAERLRRDTRTAGVAAAT